MGLKRVRGFSLSLKEEHVRVVVLNLTLAVVGFPPYALPSFIPIIKVGSLPCKGALWLATHYIIMHQHRIRLLQVLFIQRTTVFSYLVTR